MSGLKMKKVLAIALVFVLSAACHGVSLAAPDSEKAIREALQAALPGVVPDTITPSPVQGFYEVLIGPRLYYVSGDGRYLFQGSLIDLKTRVNISEERTKQVRIREVNAVGEDNMVIFAAAKPRYTITVFTDVDCTYCRKLHSEIEQYLSRGITVRYLMYPRSGLNTPSYYKAVSVWCAKDRRKALTRAKAGEKLERLDCDNPVEQHMSLGESIGIRGTPAIILDDGELLPGYVPAERLLKTLQTRS